ncbi:hypothetical protein ACTWP5_20765 [Streptomyces sp. 4N509B]|uniref:hypothetical protein n=1 Tax=Streptomyces sp. 4N509B TaxID=3457413 RepID=UPI003FD1CBAB
MRWPTRLAVALGAMALVAGCSSGGSSEPGEDAEGTAGAGGGGEQREEQQTQESEEPVAQTGFDECGLFEPAELAEIIGVPELYVTERSAAPQWAGGRLAGCGYYTDNVPGLADLTIYTVGGANEDELFAAFEGREAGPVEDLGDRAEVVAMSAPGGVLRSRELRTIDGDVGLIVTMVYGETPGGFPEIPDAELGSAFATLAVLALERVPEELTILDGEPEGPCAGIDLTQAAETLGEELVTARAVLDDAGGSFCQFSGDEAELTVNVLTDEEAAGNWSPAAEEITHPDIGDGARFNSDSGYLEARVILGERVVVIESSHTEAIGLPETPRPEDVELVRSIAASV